MYIYIYIYTYTYSYTVHYVRSADNIRKGENEKK